MAISRLPYCIWNPPSNLPTLMFISTSEFPAVSHSSTSPSPFPPAFDLTRKIWMYFNGLLIFLVALAIQSHRLSHLLPLKWSSMLLFLCVWMKRILFFPFFFLNFKTFTLYWKEIFTGVPPLEDLLGSRGFMGTTPAFDLLSVAIIFHLGRQHRVFLGSS